MLTRANEIIAEQSSALADTLKIWVPNTGVLAFVSMTDLKTWLEVGLVLLSAAYTVWRWRRDAKKKD